MRTGDEPRHARSPLRMRLALAAFGLVCSVAGVVAFAVAGSPGWELGFAALGLVALVNLLVVAAHLRQGPHYQPGRDIPPYRPADSGRRRGGGDRRAAHPPPTLESRRRWYFLLMGLCLTLFVLAWGWVRLFSPTAAIIISVVAAAIPPVAAIVANAGSSINRGRGSR
jgi:hypothetical protein